ncbi:prephenate dehydratase [Chytriomyces confervae]|uniref:Prephenate dehydratase n=1 Tax=Chytriomyces confervae TaxID=246404 RepID=A0A507CVG1_9FUNG|nr:prephenate dehydratase [Chytriomyces confervae]
MPTIMDIFKAVADKTVTYGVVPIENSTMGNVDATLDAFVSVLEGQKGGLAGGVQTLLYFTVDHRLPGSLVDALSVLKRYEINLTKIDSRPSGAMNWNYNFFIEFTGHYQDENVKNALKEMKAFCLMINVLGSYPNQTPQ